MTKKELIQKIEKHVDDIYELPEDDRFGIALAMFGSKREIIDCLFTHVIGMEELGDYDFDQLEYILKSLEQGWKDREEKIAQIIEKEVILCVKRK